MRGAFEEAGFRVEVQLGEDFGAWLVVERKHDDGVPIGAETGECGGRSRGVVVAKVQGPAEGVVQVTRGLLQKLRIDLPDGMSHQLRSQLKSWFTSMAQLYNPL